MTSTSICLILYLVIVFMSLPLSCSLSCIPLLTELYFMRSLLCDDVFLAGRVLDYVVVFCLSLFVFAFVCVFVSCCLPMFIL